MALKGDGEGLPAPAIAKALPIRGPAFSRPDPDLVRRLNQVGGATDRFVEIEPDAGPIEERDEPSLMMSSLSAVIAWEHQYPNTIWFE